MTWPHNIPPDLRRRLDAALSMRGCAAPDIWGEVREWLIQHGVEAQSQIPEDRAPDGPNEVR